MANQPTVLISYNVIANARKLPQAVFTAIFDMQSKIIENPGNKSLNIEKIKTFKDQDLRTARVNDQYRAIIAYDEKKNLYLVWHVDNHDVAMNWAKNKYFHWNEITKSAQIFTVTEGEQGSMYSNNQVEDPLQKPFFSQFSNEELLKIGVPEMLLDLVKNIYDEDDLLDNLESIPEEVWQRLSRIIEGEKISVIIDEVAEGADMQVEEGTQHLSLNNRQFFVEADKEMLEGIISGDIKLWQVFLHPTQARLAQSAFKGTVKVVGGAGTGKTVVAIHRAKTLTTNRSIARGKVLFTTYTKELTANIEQLLVDARALRNQIEVKHIDGLLMDVAKNSKIFPAWFKIIDFSEDRSKSDACWEKAYQKLDASYQYPLAFIQEEYEDVILDQNIKTSLDYKLADRKGRGIRLNDKQKDAIWAVIEEFIRLKTDAKMFYRAEVYNKLSEHFNQLEAKPFAHIIADEIQDFGNPEMRFLRSLTAVAPNDLFLVGDPFQNVYQRKLSFKTLGINVMGSRSRKLLLNYRTSEQIKNLAFSVVKSVDYDDFEGNSEKLTGYRSVFKGEKPQYKLFDTAEAELKYIISVIEAAIENGLDYKDILVAFRKREFIGLYSDLLHRNNIPYNDRSKNNITNINGIVLSTYHKAKGLEFKLVIVPGISQDTFPYLGNSYRNLSPEKQEGYRNSELSQMYVVMTRAISNLIITGVGKPSELIKI